MPTTLELDDHLTVLAEAGATLANRVQAVGLDAPVPTCPGWTTGSLLAHQTMVHRWAAAQLSGGDAAAVPDAEQIQATVEDLPSWYREGLALLISTIRAAAPDTPAMTFLRDAPPPRQFWARRQALETTMHNVDALAASLGRSPTAEETGITSTLAADGLDELLRGFVPRRRSATLFAGGSEVVTVHPSDSTQAWTLQISNDPIVTELGIDGVTPDVELTGTAAELYLGLWNRGAEIVEEGGAGFLARWHAQQHVTWS